MALLYRRLYCTFAVIFMSVISVNAGQCGNQLGFDFLNSLYDNTKHDHFEQSCFFRDSNKRDGPCLARSVCLDTEPKAVLSCIQRAARKSWNYDTSSCAYRHGGAGNNWALGYQMCSGKFLEKSMDCIRKELEHCDLPASILVMHSIGGGTGSGLGTKITEVAADEFPDVTRLNAAVMPYHFGEVIVQHYNSVLCLSKIADSSDGILLFDNEIAHDMCKTGFGNDRPTLRDLNNAIAMGLLTVFLPKHAVNAMSSSSLPMQVAHLFSHPGYKFADVKFVPQTSERSIEYTFDSWSAMIGRLAHMQRVGTTSANSAQLNLGNPKVPLDGVRGIGGVVGHIPQAYCDIERTASVTLSALLTLRGKDSESACKSLKINNNSVPKAEADKRPSSDQLSARRPPSSSGASVTSERSSRSSVGYRSSTMSSVARDASSYDKMNSDKNIQLDIDSVDWGLHSFSNSGSNGPVSVYQSLHCMNGYQRSASIASNGQSVVPYLERPALRAANMFTSGAYLHQYTKFGIESDDFRDSFLKIGQIIQNYQSLSTRMT